MRGITTRLVRYFENVPDQVRRAKWLVWLLTIVITAIAITGLGRARFDMTVEGWFKDDDPTLVGMDAFHARFGSDDHLYIIYEARDGNVFSKQSLETVRAIRKELLERRLKAPNDSPLKHIVKITDLTNAPVLEAQDDALVNRNLVGPVVPDSQQQLDEIRATAHTQKDFPRQYFSKDSRYGGILVETDFGATPVQDESRASSPRAEGVDPDSISMAFADQSAQDRVRFEPTDLAAYLAFNDEVKVTLQRKQFTDRFEYYAVGNPASTEYNLMVLEEMGLLYTAMLVIMIGVLWSLFRSWSGVLWPSLIVILSAIWTIGLASWLGATFTAQLILTVVMILVIGIADSIHVLSGYEYFRKAGQDHRTALRSVYHSAAHACFLTTVTSMASMLSVVFTPIVPIKVWGLMTAAGIGLAFLFTLYLLPLMLDLWWAPLSEQRSAARRRSKFVAAVGRLVPNVAARVQLLLQGIFPFVERHRQRIAVVSALVLAVCLFGAFQIKVNTDFKDSFPQGSQIRENIDIADREMLGSQRLEIYFDLRTENAYHDPLVLTTLESLQQQIENKYREYVVRTLSLVDVAKRSHQALHEDRPESNVIPDSQRALAQTLFMFDNSNPSERRKMVSDDYSKGHITVYLRNAGSLEYNRVFADIQKDIDAAANSLRHEYPDAKASVTGMFVLLMQGTDYLSRTSLGQFAAGIFTVTVILLMMFGSLKGGLISVVSNAVPATLSFGIMGWLGVPLDFTTVLIAPIVLGIAVDDTIHFLVHYKQELAIDGDIHRALQQTIAEVGQAVTFTALILGLGLSVLALSSSTGNASVGIYGALAVVAGLFCDLLLLPALILIFKLDFGRRSLAPRAIHEQLNAPAS